MNCYFSHMYFLIVALYYPVLEVCLRVLLLYTNYNLLPGTKGQLSGDNFHMDPLIDSTIIYVVC